MVKPIQDQRAEALQAWLTNQLDFPFTMELLPNDASFRRYFRITGNTKVDLLAVDAPPNLEPMGTFIQTQQLFTKHGSRVPAIFNSNPEQGFLLIEDFGDELLFRILNTDNANQLYQTAIAALVHLQKLPPHYPLPHFNQGPIGEELHNFKIWFLEKYLKLDLSATEQSLLQTFFNDLIQSALAQPQLCVHRDYHSRNLLLLKTGEIGIIDFQDAVIGPLTYDLVSLIRDCYVAWPRAQVEALARYYYDLAALPFAWEQFLSWFDWMGVQRHLKAIFIFARKWLRDQNPNFLTDIPRALNYVEMICANYPELKPFYDFLQQRILPAMENHA